MAYLSSVRRVEVHWYLLGVGRALALLAHPERSLITSVLSLNYVSYMFLFMGVFLFLGYGVLTMNVSRDPGFPLLNLILFFVVRGLFLSSKMICFYTFFELRLIPTALLIYRYGSNPERLRAFYYFILYTSVASFPLLVNILFYEAQIGKYVFRELLVPQTPSSSNLLPFVRVF